MWTPIGVHMPSSARLLFFVFIYEETLKGAVLEAFYDEGNRRTFRNETKYNSKTHSKKQDKGS